MLGTTPMPQGNPNAGGLYQQRPAVPPGLVGRATMPPGLVHRPVFQPTMQPMQPMEHPLLQAIRNYRAGPMPQTAVGPPMMPRTS